MIQPYQSIQVPWRIARATRAMMAPTIICLEWVGNCSDKLDDGRNYCDEECRNDHQARIASDKRNGKYRGG